MLTWGALSFFYEHLQNYKNIVMIKQVIDRSLFTLNYPHHSCFMGGIWIASTYNFLHIAGTVALVLTSKQWPVKKNEPLQFSPPQCLWAAEIIASSWDPFQKAEVENGLNPSPLPLQLAFHANQAKPMIQVMNQVSLTA